MKKRNSKKMLEERRIQKKTAKKHDLIIAISSIAPFSFTLLFTVLYAFKISYVWLSAVTSLLWFAYGGLFVYAFVKKWGYVDVKGVKTQENHSMATIYNIILVFALAIFFLVMTLYKIF